MTEASTPSTPTTEVEAATAVALAARVRLEPVGIRIGHVGPALEFALNQDTLIVFGPDSPMVDKRLEIIFAEMAPAAARELAEALDTIAAWAVPAPAAAEAADVYVSRLKANYETLRTLFEE